MNTGSAAAFASTHWSVVAAAGDSRHPEAAEALERFCQDYWRPLYWFVRRTGRPNRGWPGNAQQGAANDARLFDGETELSLLA